MPDHFEQATLLVGIGAPRTGTKWMYRYLSDHSDVLTSPIRLLDFFSQKHDQDVGGHIEIYFKEWFELIESRGPRPHLREWREALRDRVDMANDTARYIDHFRRRWTGQAAFADITPRYSKLRPEAFADMYSAHPNVRFLFVMRNPIDRAWSGLRLNWSRNPNIRIEAELKSTLAAGSWVEAGPNYLATIEGLEAAVPRSAVKYVFYESLFASRTVSEICVFAGIDDFPAEVTTVVNQSDPYALEARFRRQAFSRFEPLYHFVQDKIGYLPQSWLDDIRQFSS